MHKHELSQKGRIKNKIKQMHLTNYLQINLPHHQLIPTNAENYTKINEQQNTVYISSPRIYSTYINSKNRRLFQLQIKSSSKISRESSMNELTKRISMLEGKFYELERKLFVTQTINWHLEWMIDLQVQNSYWLGDKWNGGAWKQKWWWETCSS